MMTIKMLLFRSKRMLPAHVMMALVMMLLSGCVAPPSTLKPLLENDGEVDLFLQPFPQESERLKFTIDRLALVGSDGKEFPLSLAMTEFTGSAPQRQRFLAAGRVPPGQYRGISCRVVKASISGEEGETALLVPEEPFLVPLTIEVQRRKVLVLSLVYQHAGSVPGGFNFAPRFSMYIPSLPVTGLLGYIVNRADNTVTVFDKRTGQVAAVMATGRSPERVVLDQTVRTAYLSLEGEDTVEVIDMAEGSVLNRIRLKFGDGPRDIALTPDNGSLLTVDVRSRTLSIIDPVSLTERSRIPVGDDPRWLLIGRSGNRCYVFNNRSNTISVIDIANGAAVATIATDAGPLMGQLNRKGDRLYVIHEGSPFMLVIDTATLSVVKRQYVGLGLRVIKVDTKNDMIYASRRGNTQIEVYEPFSLNVIDFLPGTSGVAYMTIDGEANNLFLLSAEKRSLLSVSLISRKVVTETDMAEDASWVTMMGER
jgi:YVTN family beta-propeller protein